MTGDCSLTTRLKGWPRQAYAAQAEFPLNATVLQVTGTTPRGTVTGIYDKDMKAEWLASGRSGNPQLPEQYRVDRVY